MELKKFLEDEALRNLGNAKISFLVEGKKLSSNGLVTMKNEDALGFGYICLEDEAKELTLDMLKAIFKSNNLLSSLGFFYGGYMYVLESATVMQMTLDGSEIIFPLKYKTPYATAYNDDVTVSSLNSVIDN